MFTLCYQHFIENIRGRQGADNICRVKIKVHGIILEFSQDINHYVYICSVVSSSEGKGLGRIELRWAEEPGYGFEHQEDLSFTSNGWVGLSRMETWSRRECVYRNNE